MRCSYDRTVEGEIQGEGAEGGRGKLGQRGRRNAERGKDESKVGSPKMIFVNRRDVQLNVHIALLRRGAESAGYFRVETKSSPHEPSKVVCPEGLRLYVP